MDNLSTRTPVEIDTRIAELHGEIATTSATIRSLTNRVLDRSGLRVRHSATWQTRRTTWTTTGTFEDAVEVLTEYARLMDAWREADYPRDARPADLAPGYYSAMSVSDIDKIVAERAAAIEGRYVLWTEANVLDAEYRRRPWSRYFLVVSSAGHIHSSTGCQTCRLTTAFGWMPERSGMTEAEAIESLGKHADSLCSVCYPTAPVISKRTNVTKATAAKLSTAAYVRPNDEGADTE
jgi:hypothetical protein